MMGIGLGEMALIAGIALVVIGPEKFPDFAKVVVKTFRDIRGYVDDVKHEMAEELKPIKREVNQLSRYNAEQYIDSLTAADKTASGPEHDPAPTTPNAGEDPYAYNNDYGYEYQDYNPEVPGGKVETPKEGDAPSTDGAGPAQTAPEGPTREAPANPGNKAPTERDEFDIPAPERLD